MQHANLAALLAKQAQRARTPGRFDDHPPPSRKLPPDSRGNNHTFRSGVTSYFDSIDFGEDML